MKQGKAFEDLAVGMTASATHTVTEQDVIDFARVSGDHNPVHMDEAYAAQTIFGGRIAHGALTASYISAILGNDLPGPGSIFTDLNMNFKRPVRIGDTVTATASITELIPKGNRVCLAVRCEVDGKAVLKGEAKVMVPSRADRS
jgi:3-hydroxybutyryl-CoA dehydratase